MYQSLEHRDRIARKSHTCDWCGNAIKKGEEYHWEKFIYDGDFYEWRSHLSCSRIVSEIWDYVEPDEGMGSDEFTDACGDICKEFICPDCPNWNKDDKDCEKDISYCIDRMDEFFRTHELYAEREGCWKIWRCREKQAERRNTENE